MGRAHHRVELEARRDVDALYAYLDPRLRAEREARSDDEPERSLAELRAFVTSVERVEVQEVEVLEAHKVSERQGGRSEAIVRTVVRYDGEPVESRTVWVRDGDVWYTTALGPP